MAVAEPGVSLMDPDAYALDLLATTFNSFGGQLFDQVSPAVVALFLGNLSRASFLSADHRAWPGMISEWRG